VNDEALVGFRQRVGGSVRSAAQCDLEEVESVRVVFDYQNNALITQFLHCIQIQASRWCHDVHGSNFFFSHLFLFLMQMFQNLRNELLPQMALHTVWHMRVVPW
jgi:hypothetical protein